jgi:hypothetical protein
MFSNQSETRMVFQLIGGRDSTVVPGSLENAGLFEPMCSRNFGLGLGHFHNARGYQPFWKPIKAKQTAPVVYVCISHQWTPHWVEIFCFCLKMNSKGA